MTILPRARDDAPVAPVARLELGLAVALMGVIILVATILVPTFT